MNKFGGMAAFRSIVWRISRKLYIWARREMLQGPEANGEYWLLAKVVSGSSVPQPIFFDIGSRIGDWSDCAQDLFRRAGAMGRIYAFEPSSASYAYLSERFKSNKSVNINKLALSDQSGIRDFFVVDEMAGVNSLFPLAGASLEQVDSMRLDDFLASKKIDHVVFAKSDAEGHDFNILQGAAELFRQGQVDVWQFEYNHRWLAGRSQLKDVFDFIADKPYRLGKLYGNGVEIFEQWHPELERFIEANYVLVRRGCEFEKLCTPVRFNHRNVLVPAES